MACHIQIFALSRWLSINLPIEYYEFTKGIEWTIPYIHLPWEGPSADPFVGYSTMPAIAYSELLERSAVGADITYPGAQGQQMPMQTPIGGKPVFPMQIPLDGKPLTAMEYRSFFENQDMKPEAQIIMKLQDLDGWKYFGRNMFWLGVIGGGLILLHVLVLLYFKLRYGRSTEKRQNYGALAFPRLEIMLVILAMPCISQASAALIRGGTTGGLAVGIVLTGILTSFLVALLLFLSLGITMGRVLQYKEVHREGQEYHWCQEIIRRTIGPGKRGQWTWKDADRAACLVKLGPLFEDLRGPPKYMLTQIAGGGGGKPAAAERIMASEDENEDAEAPFVQKVFGILRIYYTFLESVKRVALGIVAGAHASSERSSRAHTVVVLAIASFQLFFMVLKKPFIKKRVQLVEIVAVASEVFIFAACLALIDRNGGEEEGSGVGLAMLGVFAFAFAAQVCNEWNALYRQVRFLSPDRSSFVEGAKAASVGLLLVVVPWSVLGDRLSKQQQPAADGGAGGGGDERVEASASSPGGEAQRSSNERSWLRQLRETAKASFSKEGGGGGGEASSSSAYQGKRSRSSSVASSSDSKAKAKAKGEWRSKSKGLYKDLEAIFSNR